MIMLQELALSEFYNVGDYHDLDKYSSGLYFFYNDDNELMYVGNSEHLLSRVRGHITGNEHTGDIKHNFKKYRFAILEDAVDRDIYETWYINLWKPALNTAKVFTYYTQRFERQYNPAYVKRKEEQEKEMYELKCRAIENNLYLI